MQSLLQRISHTATMLAMVTLISGCRGQLTVTVPLPMLVNNPTAFDNRQIVTQGVVRHFNDPIHYWIEDEELNRVEILPHQEIAPYLDEGVEVEGQFHFSPHEGRRLILTRVDQLPR